MARTHRWSITGTLIVCLIGSQSNATLRASRNEGPSSESTSSDGVTESTTATGLPISRAVDSSTATDADPIAAASSVPYIFTAGRPFAFTNAIVTVDPPLGSVAPGSRDSFRFLPVPSSAFSGQVYRGPARPIHHEHHGGSIAALVIGAVASITGTAILVYAHRPDCRYHEFASGCGYGTKVVGGAVVAGGVVGLVVGALTW